MDNGGTIYEFTPSGVRSTFGSPGMAPDSVNLAFDSAGNLYVADFNSYSVYKFAPDGTESSFAYESNSPRCLAVQPVPEPSGWALLAMGIGVVLGGLRLSRRQTN
jgi:hypothetical protein